MPDVYTRELGDLETKVVWYDGVGGAVAVGYAVCYDPALTIETVKRPATALLPFFAGIVVDPLRQSGTTPGFIKIAIPKRGQTILALCKSNATIAVTVLCPADGVFSLATDADAATATSGAGAGVYSRKSVGFAGETADTSTTAANKPVYFI